MRLLIAVNTECCAVCLTWWYSPRWNRKSHSDGYCLLTCIWTRMEFQTQYEMSDGSVLLHVIKDCPRSYYMSYIVKKGWPLLPTFGNRIRSLFEGGESGLSSNHKLLVISVQFKVFYRNGMIRLKTQLSFKEDSTSRRNQKMRRHLRWSICKRPSIF